MSVTTILLKSGGHKFTGYVAMLNTTEVLGAVINNELHLYAPLLKLTDKAREKVIGKLVTKARSKFGIKGTLEQFNSFIKIEDGIASVYQKDTNPLITDSIAYEQTKSQA